MKLLWIDCEMTGLDFEKDHILEICIVITDFNFKIIEKDKWIIKQSANVLENMNEWCLNTHKKSGLYYESLNSNNTYDLVEKELLEILKKNSDKKKIFFAGNSVYNDYIFIKKYLKKITDWTHYRLIDISTIKTLSNNWYKNNKNEIIYEFKKKDLHRAEDDILESIEELKYYKKNIFKND